MRKITNFMLKNLFARHDERDDTLFYNKPKMETFKSRQLCDQLTDYYYRTLPQTGKVLDLMTGAHSHLPYRHHHQEIVGLGLNEIELKNNPQLTGVTLQDLNKSQKLPYDDSFFDACIISSGIQYLVNPVAVIREVGRVLINDGIFIVSFSSNLFPQKAVKNWRRSDVKERIKLLESYLNYSGLFDTPCHSELCDEGMNSLCIVTARKKSGINIAARASYISRRVFVSLIGGTLLALTCGIKPASARSVEERVIKIVVEQLGVYEHEVKLESSFVDDLGADSLDTVELVMALEEEFEIEIPDADAEKITTVESAIKYLKNELR